MPGSPGTRPAPDLPTGPRAALVIATTSYQDPELRQLRAPAHDADDLADVLGDPHIGGFTVTRVIDQDERQVRREIDAFLSGRSGDDTVVVYLSCHGVLDRRNRLYFATADTVKIQLASTGIASSWLLDQLDECRARRQVLILDCCFSGAFAHNSKGETDLDLERRLAGHGRGRAVLTASRAGEYSFEGQAIPNAVLSGSVFTAGLIEGLRTGAADVGGDGYVSLDEAYDYAYSYVKSSGVSQTPQIWLYGGEGMIVLARNTAGVAIIPAPIPEALLASLDSPYPQVRIGAVHALCEWLTSGDPARALTAEQRLRQIAETDAPVVADAARDCLPSPKPTGTAPHSDQGIPRETRAKRQSSRRRTTATSGPSTSAPEAPDHPVGPAEDRRELKGALRELDEQLRVIVDMFEEDSSLIDGNVESIEKIIIRAYQIMKTRVYAEDSPLRADNDVWEAANTDEDTLIDFYKSASRALRIYKKVLEAYTTNAPLPSQRGDLEQIRQAERALGEEREACVEAVSRFQRIFSPMVSFLIDFK